MTGRRFFLFLIIVCCFSFPSYGQTGRASAPEEGTRVGQLAPPVELAGLDGKTVTLSSLKGSVVLLNFWSTLCAPCTAEMPSLNRLYLSLKDRNFHVLSVAIDSTDKPVREFAAKNGIAFPVLLDRDKEVFFDNYAGPGLPANYLIDRQGVIVETFSGAQVWDAPGMKDKILRLLEKR